ncbi:MAG: formate--tetrahydrofolate ligase [Bacteroidetes bacterium]|nr:formate--tetrahydrofolate ligase [Bacteroidota bacterium]MBK9523177.1 formate--tetrahydrofolate ligase [Bacteroidota bacterium]MBK9540922.1 formate--tetrahydrofolate ligase [Bacteroidota bacterium]MBP6402362.1 formate--tetrahydrofolate ligase [Bacteroidia bacterium]MBP6648980.1 formate--tetrahydrofolate ligase [Bacteroidia bacterium]
MLSAIEISRNTKLDSVGTLASKLGINPDEIVPYGRYIAKVPLTYMNDDKIKKSNLILVTAITPTKAGIGKTVTSISLSLGLNKIGKKASVALREPSLGPCFGMKGGATGGGYAQVLPMDAINLHFTGDFHAITSAHNMISALLDNHQYQFHNKPEQLESIVWKRVLDVNDRTLRNIITGLGQGSRTDLVETGFDITPASEIMALFCLATSLDDLERRIESVVLGYKQDKSPFTVKDLGVAGAITVLLKDALMPNLVQTTENTPAFVHGGPFANIAHGCNSLIATKMALSLTDYVVTEAGFGSDLGAEKFLDIKCRLAGLQPKATVLVLSTQALKLHGGVPYEETKKPDLSSMQKGIPNLERHVENLRAFGQSVVVSLNHYPFDSDDEIEYIRNWCKDKSVSFVVNYGFERGGEGASDLARAVVKVIEETPSSPILFTYDDVDPLKLKIEKIAKKIYHAGHVVLGPKAETKLKKFERLGWARLPVCIAKTQYSFSDDPKMINAPKDFTLTIQDVVINAGAGFIVAIAGEIMRMPGLPEDPQAVRIRLVNGEIEGLS